MDLLLLQSSVKSVISERSLAGERRHYENQSDFGLGRFLLAHKKVIPDSEDEEHHQKELGQSSVFTHGRTRQAPGADIFIPIH